MTQISVLFIFEKKVINKKARDTCVGQQRPCPWSVTLGSERWNKLKWLRVV
jgi:hypothetical protein